MSDWKDCDRCGTPDGEVERLQAEVGRLTRRATSAETALRDYGGHHAGCGYNFPGYNGPDCKCGWGRVKREVLGDE